MKKSLLKSSAVWLLIGFFFLCCGGLVQPAAAQNGQASLIHYGAALPSGAPQWWFFALTDGTGLYQCTHAPTCTSSGQWINWGGSSAAIWGDITGTLSSQADLQNALNLKANLASPALTGIPTVPTAAPGTSTTQAASTAFVLANGSGPSWGSITGTLSSQADLVAALALKASLASPALSGIPTAPTASFGTNTAQVASTAFVLANAPAALWGAIGGTLASQTDLNSALNLKAPLASAALTGIPTAPTAAPGTNTLQLATTAFVLANNGTAPSFSYNETPSGLINGSNTSYTLANTPNPASSLNCYLDGLHQIAGGVDFTLSTATVTYVIAPPTGYSLNCSYQYGSIGGGGSMVYPTAGIAVSTGSSWASSVAAPTGTIVGTTDTQTLTNKSIAASEVNSGVLATAQVPFASPGAIGGTTPSTAVHTSLTANEYNYAAGGGTAQAQTVTLSPAITALTTGLSLWWKPSNANTAAAPTVAVNGTTATAITKCGTVALAASDLITTAVAHAVYDGTQFELVNPQAAGCGSSSAVSSVGATTPIASSGGSTPNISCPTCTITIANGTAPLGTSLIPAGTCATTVTVPATGVLTTDNILADFNVNPTGVSGYSPAGPGVTIEKFPTAANVNFAVCNYGTAGVTPGAMTLNWRVVR